MTDRDELNLVRELVIRNRIGEARTRSLALLETGVPGHETADWAEMLETLGLGAHAVRLWRRLARAEGATITEVRHALESLDDDGRSSEADALLEEILARGGAEPELMRLRITRLRAAGCHVEARRIATELGSCEAVDLELHSQAEQAEAVEEASALLPADADLLRFLDLFAGRENVHARQWTDDRGASGYAPVRSPIDLALLRNHVLGNVTLGTYLLRLDARVSFFVLDLDIRREQLEAAAGRVADLGELRALLDKTATFWSERLGGLGFDPLLEDSGHRGRHLWVFFAEPIPARRVLDFGRKLLRHLSGQGGHGGIAVEFFPKQARHGPKGLGNLVKLPLGMHRVSGRRSRLLEREGRPIEDAWPVLRRIGRANLAAFEEALRRVERLPLPESEEPLTEDISIDPARPPGSMRVPPADSGPPWTEQHFRSEAQLAAVLEGCHLLGDLVSKTWREREAAYPEQLVLRHTLGHLPQALRGVNAIFRRLPAVPDHHWLTGILGGPVMSCASLRKRLRADPKSCVCDFAESCHSYPQPLLHALGVEAPGLDADENALRHAAEAFALMEGEGHADPDERRALVAFLDRTLRDRPDAEVRCRAGTLRRVELQGVGALVFEPDGEEEPAPVEGAQS